MQPHPQPQRCIHECVCHSYLDYQSDDLDPCLAKKCEHDTRTHSSAPAPDVPHDSYVAAYELGLKRGEEHKAEAQQPGYIRPELMAFAEAMETVLRKHDDKGGWEECGLCWLLERVEGELKEAKEKWDKKNFKGDYDSVAGEFIDVANFCMMFWGNTQRYYNREIRTRPHTPAPESICNEFCKPSVCRTALADRDKLVARTATLAALKPIKDIHERFKHLDAILSKRDPDCPMMMCYVDIWEAVKESLRTPQEQP